MIGPARGGRPGAAAQEAEYERMAAAGTAAGVVVCLRADPGAQPPQLQPLCGCDAARGRGRERAPMPTDDD